ncbi:MAG: 4Fe-4S dicluster domain-containing protein [Deltaproteobacteria bacterium]|nr:4Fe-4S dicluster domain-containing protein [Deltaproteobacteria bacterium]
MQQLIEVARQLLTDKVVDVVIGYEQGAFGVRPAFISDVASCAQLIFDNRCVHNLVSYLSPRRTHLAHFQRKAIVAKGCDIRAIAALVREGQLKREQIIIIAPRCGGVGRNASLNKPQQLEVNTVAPRCANCTVREPRAASAKDTAEHKEILADYVVGEVQAPPPIAVDRDARINALDAMSIQERWQYWQGELERCIRCHACREVCPTCFCVQCLADKTQPQWIESSPHARGNLMWQFNRMMHQAGRCVDCGECERACPVGIPLSLLVGKMAKVVKERFDYQVSSDPTVPTPIGTYNQEDKQEFIL